MSSITSFTTSLGYNGLIDVFAVSDPQGTGATVWHARQRTAGGNWSAWTDEGEPDSGIWRLRSVLDAERHGHVLALAEDGQLWFKERGPADDFSLWEDVGVPPADPAATPSGAALVTANVWGFISVWGATHADGRIDVVGTLEDGNNNRGIFCRSRPSGSVAWGDWDQLGDNDFDGDIVAAVADDNGLDIVTPVSAEDDEGSPVIGVSHRRRGPDGTWTAWTPMGPLVEFAESITPALIVGPHGKLRALAVSAAVSGTKPQLWEDRQKPNYGFVGWEQLFDPGGVITDMAAATGADGGLDVCVTLEDNTVAHIRESGQDGPWSPWTLLGHPGPGAIADPALILDGQNCLNLLLSRPGRDGLLLLRQQVPGGPFVTGPALPALPPH